jgi:hypothetical protein
MPKKERAMSAGPSSSHIEKIENQLAKLLAADKRQRKNENIVRRSKNGDLTYETIRTLAVPRHDEPMNTAPSANIYTETPDSAHNGQQFPGAGAASAAHRNQSDNAETPIPNQLADAGCTVQQSAPSFALAGISIHDSQSTGQQIAPADSQSADPLEDLLARALARPKRGRPAAFDDHTKGKLVALLSLGMSLRQAASVLGVSHGTIRNTLKADTALAEEITAARFQAQLQPLACVIREARRSWKAATWLLKYLDGKIASHEETPEERNQRQEQEIEDFHARARRQHIKTRHISG